jgi:hypothetical protein
MMDLRETTWSWGRHRQYLLASLYNHLWGRHRHYLLAHLLRNNHTTIRVNGAPAITMMTSLPIHLSNHSGVGGGRDGLGDGEAHQLHTGATRTRQETEARPRIET